MTEFFEELITPATEIAIILAIIGIVVTWVFARYYYNKGVKVGRFSLDYNQIQVIDKSTLSETPLRIIARSQNSEREINDNVYVANVTIWNSGNGEIKKEDVRKPYHLWISNVHSATQKNATATETEILELTPTFFTRDNVDKFVVDENTGKISWEHFDPGEGFRVRMIYKGEAMCEPVLKGYAVNVGEVVDYTKQREQDREGSSFPWYLLLAAVVLVPALSYGGGQYVGSLHVEPISDLGSVSGVSNPFPAVFVLMFISFVIVSIVSVIVLIGQFYFRHRSRLQPPF
jgi:hypothetical protein